MISISLCLNICGYEPTGLYLSILMISCEYELSMSVSLQSLRWIHLKHRATTFVFIVHIFLIKRPRSQTSNIPSWNFYDICHLFTSHVFLFRDSWDLFVQNHDWFVQVLAYRTEMVRILSSKVNIKDAHTCPHCLFHNWGRLVLNGFPWSDAKLDMICLFPWTYQICLCTR